MELHGALRVLAGILRFASPKFRPAGEDRQDLGDAVGFRWAASNALEDGVSHALYFYGIDSDGGASVPLSGSPATIICSPPTSGSQPDRKYSPSEEDDANHRNGVCGNDENRSVRNRARPQKSHAMLYRVACSAYLLFTHPFERRTGRIEIRLSRELL